MSGLLQVSDLHKRQGGRKAVDGVSFALADGEILGLVGPNGGGKSAAMDCILGQARPDAGTVEFDGLPITGLAPAQISRRGLGRSFHLPQGFPAGTVRENLILAGQEHRGSAWRRLLGRGDAGQGAAAANLIAHFRLDPLADRQADELPIGEQKLVDVAMAFMANPRAVMLDEPSAGLNPAAQATLADRLCALSAERRTAIVVVDHNLDFAAGLCTRVLVMAEGRIIAEGPPAAMRTDARVIEAYLGN